MATMQEGWQRRHAHLDLDRATLDAMLAPAVPNHMVLAAEPLGGGLANTNYRVTLAGLADPVVVRVFTRDESACAREVALWRLTHDRVPVPEILYADEAGALMGRPYQVARWVEGVKLDDLLRQGSPDDLRGAGEAVGATLPLLAAYIFPVAGFFAPDLTIADLLGDPAEACLAYVRAGLAGGQPVAHLGEELARRLSTLVADNEALLLTVDPTPRLTHCDYKAQNLLVRRQSEGQWRTAAVLDWEFAAATSPLFDLGNLLRYSDRLPPAFEQGVTVGYTSGGGILPPAWKRVIRLMDLVNLLTFLDTPDTGDPMIAEVVGLVRDTIEQWETL